jgi:hypothetical protein
MQAVALYKIYSPGRANQQNARIQPATVEPETKLEDQSQAAEAQRTLENPTPPLGGHAAKRMRLIVHCGMMKSGTTWLELMISRLFERQIVHVHGSNHWPAKNLQHFIHLNRRMPLSIRAHYSPEKHETFEQYQLPTVFAFRHPGDVVTSLHYHLLNNFPDQYSGDFSRTLDHFAMIAGKIAWRKFPDVFVTRYEDLLDNPAGELRRFGDYLEVDVDEPSLEYVIKHFSFENIHKRKPGEEDIKSWGRKGIVGDHVNFLVGEKRELWEQRFPGIAQEWGYQG